MFSVLAPGTIPGGGGPFAPGTGGSRTRPGRSEAEDGEAVARVRRPAQDSANSRGGLRRGRIDPGNHRGQAIKLALERLTLEVGDAPFA